MFGSGRKKFRIVANEQLERGAGAARRRAGSKITVYGSTRPKSCPVCLSDRGPSGGHSITREGISWKCVSCGHMWR